MDSLFLQPTYNCINSMHMLLNYTSNMQALHGIVG